MWYLGSLLSPTFSQSLSAWDEERGASRCPEMERWPPQLMTCGLSREVDGTLSVTWTAAASVTNPEGFHVENDALQPPAQARLAVQWLSGRSLC